MYHMYMYHDTTNYPIKSNKLLRTVLDIMPGAAHPKVEQLLGVLEQEVGVVGVVQPWLACVLG